MKVAVVSKGKDFISKWLAKHGLKKVAKGPDVVIAFGGDGTFLYAEQKFPGVPKLLLYHSSSCKNCKEHNFAMILNTLREKRFEVQKFMKLQVDVKGKKFYAMNDVNIHYVPPCALRYEVRLDGLHDSYIGDGVVIATPYGSSAYFYSISRKTFKTGIGIAINNATSGKKNFVIADNRAVRVKVIRGPGLLAVDCVKEVVKLNKGDSVVIQKSKPARLIKLKGYNLKIKRY
ncbi:NAD(+)/NADH kinase [Candidatus Woesearchaeota archaeon]|nr:NAD(+)/NADH kinase [Candidatus Woesearchaeota archaeon]MBW3022092.1 NAD(+)/NADH kinase [Candidatus Woesearchaeota archaeon]